MWEIFAHYTWKMCLTFPRDVCHAKSQRHSLLMVSQYFWKRNTECSCTRPGNLSEPLSWNNGESENPVVSYKFSAVKRICIHYNKIHDATTYGMIAHLHYQRNLYERRLLYLWGYLKIATRYIYNDKIYSDLLYASRLDEWKLLKLNKWKVSSPNLLWMHFPHLFSCLILVGLRARLNSSRNVAFFFCHHSNWHVKTSLGKINTIIILKMHSFKDRCKINTCSACALL